MATAAQGGDARRGGSGATARRLRRWRRGDVEAAAQWRGERGGRDVTLTKKELYIYTRTEMRT
uniref:Uncharacterized protein n=1 Tax=Oryza sativa subsp. japonica TaxID=39947 RepID=Q33B38_ORYSJ|nr:hypothetical protein LOC_Os10g05430 [Oryza sativa Japonica Group]